MQDKFILERKNKYIQTDKYPKIRVGQETYAMLTEMARESGMTIAEVAGKAIGYASDNLVYVDEA